MEKIEAVFKALSDRTRLRIMSVLILAGDALCICEIVDALELPQYSISKHIRELKIAGLVQERKEGKFVFYGLLPANTVFHKHLLKTLGAVSAPGDASRLQKRLAMRENNRCVVGLKKCGCRKR